MLSSPMKRIPLLLLLISLLLGACVPAAPTATPAAAATSTSIPTIPPTATVTPTPSPTPIPTLPPSQIGGMEGVPDPHLTNPELFDLTDRDAPIPQFVNAMRMAGIEVEPKEVAENLQFQILHDKDSKPFVVGAYHFDPDLNKAGETLEGPIPLLIAEQGENGEWGWKEYLLRDSEKINSVLWGTSVDGAEPWNTRAYRRAAGRFNLIKVDGGYRPEVLAKWHMGDDWVQFAKEGNLMLFPTSIYYHSFVLPGLEEENYTKEEVIQAMRERARTILRYIKATDKPGIVPVSAEDMWWWEDHPGWEKSPQYDVFGRDLIAEAFLIVYEEAQNLCLEPGRDIHLLYSEYGIEIDNPKSRFVYQELQRTKEIIAQRLGIPANQVPLEVDMHFHIWGKERTPIDTRPDELSKENIITNLRKFAEIGPVHITELEINEVNDLELMQSTLALVVESALDSGVVKSITFYDTLNRVNPWHAINNEMFSEGDYAPKDFYYRILQLSFRERQGSAP